MDEGSAHWNSPAKHGYFRFVGQAPGKGDIDELTSYTTGEWKRFSKYEFAEKTIFNLYWQRTGGTSIFAHERDFNLLLDNFWRTGLASGLVRPGMASCDYIEENICTSIINMNARIGILIDGESCFGGSGDGWAFANGVLTLNQARAYTLTGLDATSGIRVEVTANATVTLDGLDLFAPELMNDLITVSAANARVVLKGDSKIRCGHGFSSLSVRSGAKLTVAGSGALVGGREEGCECRCVMVEDGGEAVLEGGTVRDYILPSCMGGTLEKGEDGVWTVTTSEASVTVSGLTADDTLIVPPSVKTISGFPGTIRIVAFGVDITDAFTITGGAIALNLKGTVTIGGVTIPVKPTIGDLDDKESEPFVVGEGSAAVTVKAIPGLKYGLKRTIALRSDEDNGWAVADGPVTATNGTVTLTDDEPPADKAFYRVGTSAP